MQVIRLLLLSIVLFYNSSISVPIVVVIVTPNGTQVSGYGNVSNFNFTEVDGNTVLDIASISKNICGHHFGRYGHRRVGQPK